MIIPDSPENLAKMTDAEVTAAYVAMGFDIETAEAYTTVLRGDASAVVSKASYLLTVDSARELAASVGHDELLAEIAKSEASNMAFVELAESENGEVIVAAPKGAMIGMFFGDEVRKAAGVPDPYLELVRVEDDLSAEDTRTVVKIAAEVAARHPKIDGLVGSNGEFHGPGFESLRSDMLKSLRGAGVKAVGGPKVARLGNDTITDPLPVSLETVTAAIGSYRYDNTLREEGQFAKSVEEKRFTLAPMYIPGQYDSQGDWAEADDLQEAVWRFSRGDRLIALQHHPEAGSMGEAVEMMVMPWEHTVPMYKADGTAEDVTFPAGTPWLGVIWNEDVWPLVKAGKVRGYSIGGKASLLNVELPGVSPEKG